jgi:hypothetical protein
MVAPFMAMFTQHELLFSIMAELLFPSRDSRALWRSNVKLLNEKWLYMKGSLQLLCTAYCTRALLLSVLQLSGSDMETEVCEWLYSKPPNSNNMGAHGGIRGHMGAYGRIWGHLKCI